MHVINYKLSLPKCPHKANGNTAPWYAAPTVHMWAPQKMPDPKHFLCGGEKSFGGKGRVRHGGKKVNANKHQAISLPAMFYILQTIHGGPSELHLFLYLLSPPFQH